MLSSFAFLDGLGAPELLVIGVFALLMFGSKNMPELGRALGRAIREFKRATSGVEENIREVLYSEPSKPTLRAPTQRRAYRDPSAHADTAPTPVTASAQENSPVTKASTEQLNQPAPLEAPDFAREAETPLPPERRDETPPST